MVVIRYLQRVSVMTNQFEHLILLFPGNPGHPGFYVPFIEELKRQLDDQVFHVCCIGHQGHTPGTAANGAIHTLEDQIKYKVDTAMRLAKDKTVSLIGYSIGAFVALELVQRFPQLKLHRIILLQPTLMKMDTTPNGRRLAPLFPHYDLLSRVVQVFLAWLPDKFKYLLARLFCGFSSPKSVIDAAVGLINRSVVRNVLYMAHHEMLQVQELRRYPTLEHNKLVFLYAENDGWVPSDCVEHLMQSFPKAHHETLSVPHAFMLDVNGSFKLASRVAEQIQSNLPQSSLKFV